MTNPLSLEAPDVSIVAHQRSGTHLLQSLLASHPQIHGRGEFILHYRRLLRGNSAHSQPGQEAYVYRNRPGYLNVAIVMYSQLDTFEQLFGPLNHHAVIHLLREPENVGRSIAQMEADRAKHGKAFRAHYHEGEAAPPHEPYSESEALSIATAVRTKQLDMSARLGNHPRLLTVSYEDLTGNRHTHCAPPPLSFTFLQFLQLDDALLSTSLRKS